jgi:hypothetical protein
MSIVDFFYKAKPFLPRRTQIALRRAVACVKVHFCRETWPIDASAGCAPAGWTRWPENKKFALVLSHDVESIAGHDRCLQLMKIEKRLGFRSSFNFVPEDYRVSPALRQTLHEKGFEIGVHGLVHDGKLFSSRRIFEQRAPLINSYLEEWAAAGFHSPSMIHNLDWIAELDIEYDCSTFDTDPFEPEPDGIRSIFPVWVKRNGFKRGYVELPYTLPQDHCLFVILKEKDITIWQRKLDWIAERGGMALLNTHPDYMNFNGGKLGLEEYPARFYVEFLEYVKAKYPDQCWHVLPREMSRFWSEAVTP